MIDKSIDDYLEDLASKAPTPGGGGAAAIMGAMGAALVSMVCNLTVGKQGYEAVASEMHSTRATADRLRVQLAELVRSDAQVFDQVMGAYRLPKDTEGQKQARSTAIEQALKAATEVPLACARLCSEVISLSRVVAEIGNRNVVSDAGVAVMGAYAGLKSAALNVYINTRGIKDESFVKTSLAELDHLLAEGEAAADNIFLAVRNQL